MIFLGAQNDRYKRPVYLVVGVGVVMTKILGKVSVIARGKKDPRPLEPSIFAKVEGEYWAFYVCVHRDGEYRRIALPLQAAQVFLQEQLGEVQEALNESVERELDRR